MSVYRFLCAVIVLILIPAGCERPKPAQGGGGPPSLPKVTAAKPLVRNVVQWDVFPGTLAPVEQVEVRAQVSGFVESVTFTEGSQVKKGDLLATIDSRIFQAQLDVAKAELLQARARLEQTQAALQLAQNDFKRAQDASATGGIAAEELDTRRATVSQAQANVSVANAAIASAEASIKKESLNIDWCRITAPISGKVSDKNITPGNMLSGGPGTGTTRLTTINSVDPIYCYVNVDETTVLKYQKLAREKKRTSAEDARIPCYMQLDNETGFPHVGVVDFVDNKIDSKTATRRARGIFPNPDGALLPGNYAKVRVTGEEIPNAMLVIDDAIGIDQDRRYIYVLRPDHTIERRLVTVGPLEGELRIIREGLKPDELVLINGTAALMMIRPDMKVDPTVTPMLEHRLPEAQKAAAATAAAASASAPAAATQNGGR